MVNTKGAKKQDGGKTNGILGKLNPFKKGNDENSIGSQQSQSEYVQIVKGRLSASSPGQGSQMIMMPNETTYKAFEGSSSFIMPGQQSLSSQLAQELVQAKDANYISSSVDEDLEEYK